MQHDIHSERDAGADSEDRGRKLRRISRVAEWLALAGMVGVLAYSGYLWSNQAALSAFLLREVPGVAVAAAGGSMILAGMLSLIPVAIFVAAMWEVRRLFRLLGKSRVLDPAVPRLLVRLGRLAVAAAVAGIVVRTLVVLVMTSSNPPGQKHLVIGIGSNEFASLIIGLLLFAFALVVQESLRIVDENRSFV